MVVWIILLLFGGPVTVLPGKVFKTQEACEAFAGDVLGPLPYRCYAVEQVATIG